jgi:hypothetical protein
VTELTDYQRLVEKPHLARLHAQLAECHAALAKLQADNKAWEVALNSERELWNTISDQLEASVAKLQAERDEAREALRPFVLFFDAAIDAWSDGRDFDGSDIQDTAAHLGLLVETTFDPEKHTDETGVGANEGDQWFVLSDAASNAVRAASRALGGGE